MLRQLCGYDWPGNVRQLENAIERLVLLTRGSEIQFPDLPDYLQSRRVPPVILPDDLPDAGLNFVEMEKELLIRTLRKFGGNQTRAASFLQLSRRTLAYRLEKYGISRTEFTRVDKRETLG